ncbi:response regulator [Mameliella sp. CS4]|uniref:ATP-binding protein n=1 Tax=Mameliella sp. CS4 TaxID=2862329 RepID=UPI001C60739D|nr:ATP-binding protein [Mameliella sp. CS4]MBW4981929.1 response regulator [Mameliella sp. CS4]
MLPLTQLSGWQRRVTEGPERTRGREERAWLSSLPNWLTGIVLVMILVSIAVLVLDLQQQTRRLASSAADNMQWTLGQAEVELMALEIAALRADKGDDSLSEVRLRYDIFYSRVETLTESHRFEALMQIGVMPERIEEIQAFRKTWLPFIDGPDEALQAALPTLAEDARSVRATVRDTSLAGVEFFSQQGFAQRDSLSRSMVRVGLLTVTLVILLAVLALMLFRLARKSDAEARANRETRERIETILSTSLDAVVVSDEAGRILDYNGAAERIFGYDRNQALGADMADLIVPDHYRAAHRRGMDRFRHDGDARVIGKGIVRLDARRSDGTVFPVDLSLARAQSPAGEIYVAFLRDISDRVRNEAELKRARDRAIAGEKQKAELLAVMSHEMRTPLNGMLGTLELVDDKALDARHQRYLRIVRESGRILLRHVNDVLDISRLDAGKMTLRKTGFDLVSLLEDIIDNQRQHASARGNRLILVPPNPELHRVYGDPERLRQILLNLVGNAIKFTWNGRITLEADCAAGLESVELRVTDTGIGIAEEDIDRIFEDFVTIDSTYGRSTSGTGLGLGISLRLATVLGGELGVESEPGDGSVFWLRVPLAPPEEKPMPEAPSPERSERPPACDILLVEDNEINRLVGRDLLERDGHRVETANSGEAALAILATRCFDVVMMDISMPGMDGINVSRALRRRGGINATTPVVATTAHALPQELEAFHAAGMQAVLIKPLTLDAIRKVLTEVLTGNAPDRPAPINAPAPGDRTAVIDEAHLDEMRQELAPARLRHLHERFLFEMTDFAHAMPDLAHGGTDGRATLAAEAHRMAGSAAMMGAGRLVVLLQEIEQEAKAGDTMDLDARQADLAECWQTTRDALSALLRPVEQLH